MPCKNREVPKLILCFIADGRSIHTQRWAEYFVAKGHEVHLVTYDPMSHPIPGVSEHVVSSRWKNLYLAFLPRRMAIKRLVKKIHPDLIHAHFITKYGFHLLSFPTRPKVASAWGDDVLILPKQSRLIRFYTKKVFDTVDRIYAVSANIRTHIIEDFDIPPQKVFYLPFGIDTDLFSPASDTPQNRTTIEIFNNRGFFPVYDGETLVQGFAAAYAVDRRLRLTLKGDGPEEQKIQDLVTLLGVDEVVTFRKKTAYADVPTDYHHSDIFITTSRSDGTPVSLLEAMASAVPCIATAVGGIPEWIDDKRTGILIPPGSPEKVAETILLLARDPKLRESLGMAARATVVERGQWKTLMAMAEKDYEELIRTYRKEKS
jgi:glycosyltransferase involved in cell wall biosynthesis